MSFSVLPKLVFNVNTSRSYQQVLFWSLLFLSWSVAVASGILSISLKLVSRTCILVHRSGARPGSSRVDQLRGHDKVSRRHLSSRVVGASLLEQSSEDVWACDASSRRIRDGYNRGYAPAEVSASCALGCPAISAASSRDSSANSVNARREHSTRLIYPRLAFKCHHCLEL